MRVPEFISGRDKRLKILVISSIRKMDKIGIRSIKSCAARQREECRHAVSKFKIVVSVKLAVEKR